MTLNLPYQLYDKAQCENKDKAKIVADKLCKMAYMARKEGLLSLGNKIKTNNKFLKEGLELISYGHEASDVEDYVMTSIQTTKKTGESLLIMIMMGHVLLLLQKGTNPRGIAIALDSYTGD